MGKVELGKFFFFKYYLNIIQFSQSKNEGNPKLLVYFMIYGCYGVFPASIELKKLNGNALFCGLMIRFFCARRNNSGKKRLKELIFSGVKAYNHVQMFSFITECMELYYCRKLLSAAHNRLDRYISLKYQGLNCSKIRLYL